MINIYQLAIIIWTITVSLRKGVWKSLDTYYPTLLYFAVGDLIYEYIAHSKYHLWEMRGIGKIPEEAADFIYLFLIVIPAILIYLAKYPNTPKERIIHILKWILIFTVVEWIGGRYFDAIDHHHGWNIWWSLLFNFFMFPMLRLHFLYYKRALLLSVPFTFFYLIWFHYI